MILLKPLPNRSGFFISFYTEIVDLRLTPKIILQKKLKQHIIEEINYRRYFSHIGVSITIIAKAVKFYQELMGGM